MNGFNPLMLVVARESRRESQSSLAKAAGVSPGSLSHYELGITVPPPAALQKIAAALNYPVSLFMRSVRFQQLPDSFFRKGSRVSVRDVNAIRAKVNLFRLRMEILLRTEEIEEPRLALTRLLDRGATPEQAAQNVRRHWNLPPGPIADLTAAVEAAGVLVVPFDFSTARVDGLSLYDPADHLPPMIFLNPSMPADRRRFTLAHELGHIVMHHHLPLRERSETSEDEAHAFASELLMPKREIWGMLGNLSMINLASLKYHWRVSMRALLKRAEQLDRISSHQARRLWMQLSREGIVEPATIDDEQPATVRRIVSRHLGELGLTAAALADALFQSVDEFRAEFGVGVNYLRLS